MKQKLLWLLWKQQLLLLPFVLTTVGLLSFASVPDVTTSPSALGRPLRESKMMLQLLLPRRQMQLRLNRVVVIESSSSSYSSSYSYVGGDVVGDDDGSVTMVVEQVVPWAVVFFGCVLGNANDHRRE